MRNFFKELTALENLYRDLIQALHLNHPNLDIIVHGYDYIIPNNPNVEWTWYQKSDKSWLGNPMVSKNIRGQKDKQAVINYIIDLFNEMLSNISKEIGKVHWGKP